MVTAFSHDSSIFIKHLSRQKETRKWEKYNDDEGSNYHFAKLKEYNRKPISIIINIKV